MPAARRRRRRGIPLRERLLGASALPSYEKSKPAKKQPRNVKTKTPAINPLAPARRCRFPFNPIVTSGNGRRQEKLYLETAYVSVPSELIKLFSRGTW